MLKSKCYRHNILLFYYSHGTSTLLDYDSIRLIMTTSSVNENDHKFFTTSDLLKTINGILKEHSPEEIASDDGKRNDESTKSGGFELQRRLPDGSTRKADESDIAIADFQSKIKQVRMLTVKV